MGSSGTPSIRASRLLTARRRFEAGDLAGAADLARQAASGAGRAPEALMLWGVAAAEAGDYAQAIAPLRKAAAQSSPQSAPGALARVQLGRALVALGRWREGLATLDGVDARALPDQRLRLRLGQGYLGAGQVERALPHLREAAQALASDPEARVDLAFALASLGAADDARVHYEAAIALAPRFGRAHAGLANLRRWDARDNHVPRLRALLESAENPASRAEAGYALFKELDDLGDREAAWMALSGAHEAAISVDPWSADADRALVEALIRRFPSDRFRRQQRAVRTDGGAQPIFVFGLPRSGTTLVERILSSHSQVTGLGEPPFFPIAFREAAGASALEPITARTISASRGVEWRTLGAAYLREAGSFAGGAANFVDKLPFNSLLAGPIRLALPGARLVLVERDPMDSLWSAHRNPFQIGGWYGWTRRQSDLAAHYANHRRLMDHWREALGDDLVVVRYETLAADPKAAITMLLERCGLSPEPACFEPERAKGAVLTLSQASARAPISGASIGAWRAYADKLEPLRAALDTLGITSD